MHKAITLVVGFLLTACMPPQFDIVQAPAGKTADLKTLDATQCSRKKQVHGPWLLGVGSAVIHGIAVEGYEDCMTALGYIVREKE